MAVDRIANFIRSAIDSRFPLPDLRRNSAITENVGNVLLKMDYTPNIIEIPAFAFSNATLDLRSSRDNNFSCVYSIWCNPSHIERKQVTTILNNFTVGSRNSVMVDAENKGIQYYGYPGLVVDSDFNPLVCFKVRIKRVENRIFITDYLCYVSSKIFSQQEGIIEKTIYKKIIPYCATYVLHNDDFNNRESYSDYIKYDWEGKHIEVIIKDNIECFHKINTPTVDDFKDDNTIKSILLGNLDSFI